MRCPTRASQVDRWFSSSGTRTPLRRGLCSCVPLRPTFASGLVLANGGDTVTFAAGAKTFTLPTAVDTGANYLVAIQTQPSGQTCTVANGSGTMQSANVANVVVTCAVDAFNVGGAVSGLNGAGLVLANGSDAITVNAGATEFKLPTAVAKGSSYSVTVKTQPAGEACAVSNGTGTMAGAAVTNVSVTCTDQPFTLGGSISGLTTAGLVLANGSDTRTVAANATSFTLPTQVKYDSTYAVTVKTQPTGLTCSVSAGSGTMPAKAVTTVAVSCSPQAYALGGTVTGLTTGSAVLADGTDTVTLNTGATTFSLPTHIAFGSHYALSIQTQPTGLVCSLGGNSSGTMPAAAVSVAMTCSPNTFTLGGTITGLTLNGLVLANGSDTVTVAAGAAQFTMNNAVAYGSTYSVTVSASPIGEWCTLAGTSGTATTDISSVVQIACTAITAGTLTTWTVPTGVTSIQV